MRRAFRASDLTLWWFFGAALFGLAIQPASANITYNPGFELGGAGWTINPNLTDSWTRGYGGGLRWKPVERSVSAFGQLVGAGRSRCVGAYPGQQLRRALSGSARELMYQDLSTVAGDNYSLTFWFVSDGTRWRWRRCLVRQWRSTSPALTPRWMTSISSNRIR